ncbi:MAG TPA: hypothetical protein VK549_01675 [Acidimicrobiia bacterium]|nr:hypothetical protein [Acidimicrobiia bacterium]
MRVVDQRRHQAVHASLRFGAGVLDDDLEHGAMSRVRRNRQAFLNRLPHGRLEQVHVASPLPSVVQSTYRCYILVSTRREVLP